MSQLFRLFWLRESGCDAGVLRRADELEPSIRERLLALAANPPGQRAAREIVVRLPFLSNLEWRIRSKVLREMKWERHGDTISPVLRPGAALRDHAATLALTDPVWLCAPTANDPNHFPIWQDVSLTLQSALRSWIPRLYFQDIGRFADRDSAFPMLVYEAAHLCRSRSRGEFTYSFNDYPGCRLTLDLALKMTGLHLQRILADAELRLREAGMTELARRYSPIWYQDLVVAVRKKPRPFLNLLRAESAFIEAVIDLSLNRTPAGVMAFSKAANLAFRRVYGMDLRPIGARALDLVTETLSVSASATSKTKTG